MKEAVVLVKELQSKKGQPFNIATLLNACVSNVMCSINFGQRFEHDDSRFLSLLRMMDENIRISNIMLLGSIFPFLKYIPGDPFKLRMVLHNVEKISDFIYENINDHENSFDETNIRDFIDVYIKKSKSEEGNPDNTYDSKFSECSAVQKLILLVDPYNLEVKLLDGKISNKV
jgi:hypothetical protein